MSNAIKKASKPQAADLAKIPEGQLAAPGDPNGDPVSGHGSGQPFSVTVQSSTFNPAPEADGASLVDPVEVAAGSGESTAEVAPSAGGASAISGDPGSETNAAAVAGDVVGKSPGSDLEIPVELNPVVVKVYPLRTYQDDGELRRRGGNGYLVAKRHADALALRGLATFKRSEE
jgi:hypothetical protein